MTTPGSSLDIGAATPDGGGWHVTRYEELVRPDVDLWPSISADGVLLLYGQVGANPGNPFKILWQVTRAAPARSSPWSTQRDEVFEKPDGGSTLPPDLEWPAMTPDGLGLFYALAKAPEVWFVERARRADVFFSMETEPTPIPALAADGFTTRVRSMTADGCELYLTSDRDGVEDAYVATRQ